MAAHKLVAAALLACGVSASAATVVPARLEAAAMSVEQVVEKNVAARGGLQAWRNVETMAWVGHVQGDAGSAANMPFVMELKRPNQTRFDISTAEGRFSRIFDGTKGWRLRPGAGGLPEAKNFSSDEVAFSRDEFVIDGPLIDHEAKGIAVKLAGLDEIEGRKAYLLEVTLAGGGSRRVWIDAQTFLEIRCDRPSTSPLTKGVPVSVYYRDFRAVDGLLIAHTIETRAGLSGRSQTLTIDRIAVNPPLAVQAFAKPAVPKQRHRGAIVRVGGDPAAPAPANAMH